MGCDIHMVLERRNGEGKWVGIDTFAGHESLDGKGWYSPIATSRNYERFARLAGVRGDGPAALGIPDDASDTTRLLVEEWGADGHSHSWISLKDAAHIFLETQHHPSAGAQKWPTEEYFGICTSDQHEIENNYRLVFWFDN